EPVDIRMQGATQTWDGLRIYWEREPRAAAYEVIASDHQIFGEELADALAGKADFTTATAVAPSVTCVLANVTPRESRGWYAVLGQTERGLAMLTAERDGGPLRCGGCWRTYPVPDGIPVLLRDVDPLGFFLPPDHPEVLAARAAEGPDGAPLPHILEQPS